MHLVFAYGTLRDPDVRQKVLRVETVTTISWLRGFRMSSVKLDGTVYPIIVEDIFSEEVIEGEYFEVSDEGLGLLDDYESEAYRRKKVQLSNSAEAWVYYA